jgi:hypothetical protein
VERRSEEGLIDEFGYEEATRILLDARESGTQGDPPQNARCHERPTPIGGQAGHRENPIEK